MGRMIEPRDGPGDNSPRAGGLGGGWPRHEVEAVAGDLAATASSAAARACLARILPGAAVTPASDGRPLLQPPHTSLWVSLSHTPGAVAAAVHTGPVGVDVQALADIDTSEVFLSRVCSARERAAVRSAPVPAAELGRLWARKEAVVKAVGGGLARLLAGIDVLDDTVDLEGPLRLVDLPAPAGTVAALAVRLTSPAVTGSRG